MQENFYRKRERDSFNLLGQLLSQLPPFCNEFFLGIENGTSILTRKAYAYDLRIFFEYLQKNVFGFAKPITQFNYDDLQKVNVTQIEMFLNYLNYYEVDGKYYSNRENGKSRKLATIRSLFKYFYNKDVLIQNVASKVSMPKIHEKPIVKLEIDEVVKLLDFVENVDKQHFSPTQLAFMKKTRERDFAMLTLFLGTGIRISECVGLNIQDIDFNVNGFSVTRKGGNRTTLYFSYEVSEVMQNYIKYRSSIKGVNEDEPALFLSLQKKRISMRAVEDLVKKYARVITPLKKITPHKLRSTFGTALYHETQDIYVVADVLGHKDVNTTKRHYASISDEIRRNAANKVKLREED